MNDPDIRKKLINSGIRECFISILERNNLLSIQQLFSYPATTLSISYCIPMPIIKEILKIVSSLIIPPVNPIKNTECITLFNDAILDKSLSFPNNGIIEICGLAGSGKSNMTFHIAVQMYFSNPNRKVVYINTEGPFPNERLRKIASYNHTQEEVDEFMAYFQIIKAEYVNELCEIINTTIPAIFVEAKDSPPSLVIIDSIAALFRLEFSQAQIKQRTQLLFDISTTLKWISTAYNALIITTNQATANMNPFTSFVQDWVPSLGLSWSYCINTRLVLTKTSMKREISLKRDNGSYETYTATLRTIRVELSPRSQDVLTNFYISETGIHGL